jgi:hypothetical protein
MEGNFFKFHPPLADEINDVSLAGFNAMFAFVSHSENHPDNLLVKDKQIATPPREGN